MQLKRRCLYHWIDYPSLEKEYRNCPGARAGGARDAGPAVVGFVRDLRNADLYKRPGVAETIDWLNALVALDQRSLDEETVNDTLGALLSTRTTSASGGAVSRRIIQKVTSS